MHSIDTSASTDAAYTNFDKEEFETYLRKFAAGQAPDFLFRPISSREAAELLGLSEGALRISRHRGKGPSGFAHVPGVGWRYPSRLEVLKWFRGQHAQALLEPSERGAA